MCEYRRYPTVINLKNPLLTNKMAYVSTAISDRIMFFVKESSSVGSFVNVKNGATCQLQVKALLA